MKKVTTPIINKLSKETNLTVHIGILEGLKVLIVNKAEPSRNMQMVSRIGSSVPAHCTGQGKTLLAYSPRETVEEIISFHGLKRYTPNTINNSDQLFEELETIRNRRYTFDNSEHESKIKCLAVPILNKEGELEAALSISGINEDFKNEKLKQQHLEELNKAKKKIRREMGFVNKN